MRRAKLPLLLGGLLIVLFAVRAVYGVVGGLSYVEGRDMASGMEYEEALPYLARGAVGIHRAEALWLAGQVRYGQWQLRLAAGEDEEVARQLLLDAHRDFTEAISMSPASGWYWAALGELYHQLERLRTHREGLPLSLVGLDRWGFVSRYGRIAIGLLRIAIDSEPSVFLFHDQLAFMFLEYKLQEPALQQVRRSAEAQPMYPFHAYDNLDPAPPAVLQAFVEASRGAVGRTPLLRRVLHLIALGKLELKRGNYEQAEQDLRAALELPAELINRAEANYYLGLALTGQGRNAEALEALVLAEDHENLEALALAAQARIAVQEGRPEDALSLLRLARREEPRELAYALEFARVARELEDWDRALEALRWARIAEPTDSDVLESLGRTYVAMGDLTSADRVIRELEELGDDDEAEDLRELREAAGR